MKEHWGARNNKKEDSHIYRHFLNEHRGAEEPKFMVRAVKLFKSALTRQLGDAIRIRRRGGQGCIINSKSEFDRCRIPKLTIDEKEGELNKAAEKREQEELDLVIEQIENDEQAWGANKSRKITTRLR